MARKLGTYPLSSNIEIEAGAPLDARTLVPTKADLTTDGNFPYSYVGMEVLVASELKKYRLTAADTTVSANWEAVDFSGDYRDLTNTPQNVSDFNNDAGYLTSFTETDPTVPAWAKAQTKPSYNFSEIGSTPTTIAGYGITDAKIANGVITLGSNTITPVTDVSGKADKATTLAGYGITDAKIANGTITLGSSTITPVTQVKVGTTTYNPTSGAVSLPAYPTTLPASDVYDWAKASTKPSYTASEVGALSTSTTYAASDTVGGAATNIKTSSTSGYTTDQYGNFKHQSNSSSSYWNIQKYDGNNVFSVYFETGNVTAIGTVTADKFVGDISGGTGLTSSQVTTALGYTPLSSTTVRDYAWTVDNAQSIPASSTYTVDLNTFVTAGNYSCTQNTTSQYITNQPITAGTAFNLIVIKNLNSTSYIRQMYWNHNNNYLYVRYSTDSGSTWSSWRNLAANDNTNTKVRIYRQTTGYNSDYPLVVSRTVAGSIGTSGTDSSYSDVYGVMWNDTTKVPTLNPSTGLVKATKITTDISTCTGLTKSQVTTALGYTPPTSDTNTTYTLSVDSNNIKLTPSSGTANSITVPYATKAAQDGDGNTISSTYMKKGTDYVTAGRMSGVPIGTKATAEGYQTTATGNYAHAEGSSVVISGQTYLNQATGEASHVEGQGSKSTGIASHAEGYRTTASNNDAHAEGSQTTASGPHSHAEGNGTTASGSSAHAEGDASVASGDHAHAGGMECEAEGNGSFAMGNNSYTAGDYSAAFGEYSSTSANNQFAVGKYNNDSSNYAFMVGNGSSNNYKNAFTVDWNGDCWAGRSNGLTDNTKLPTGADIISNKILGGLFNHFTMLTSWEVNPTGSEINTCILTFTFTNYLQMTGILFTRYAIHAVSFWWGTTVSSGGCSVTRLGGSTSETFTTSIRDNAVTLKSSSSWNNFALLLTVNAAGKADKVTMAVTKLS